MPYYNIYTMFYGNFIAPENKQTLTHSYF